VLAAALILATATLGAPEYARLDCGLRVVVLEDHTLPLVSVQLWFGAGPALEPPDAAGATAALLETLEERDATAVRLAALGVRTGRMRLPEAVCLSATLPPALLEPTLAAMATRLRPLGPGELTAAGRAEGGRGEASEGADPADLAVKRRLLAALLKDHPYVAAAREPIGKRGPIDSEALREFADRWFVPGNATLLVIGDVTPPTVMELVRQRARGLAWAEPPRRPEWRLPAAERMELPPPPNGVADGLAVAWLTAGLGQVENVALAVLMERLCNPVDGPVYRRLTAAGFGPPSWEHEAWRDAGVLILTVARPLGDPPIATSRPTMAATQPAFSHAAQIIWEEVGRAAAELPEPIEFDRARALAARRRVAAGATFEARARDLGVREVIGGDLLTATWEAGRARTLPVGALQQAARTLTTARRVIAPRLRSDRTHATTPSTPVRQLSGAEALALFRASGGDAPVPPLVPPSAVRTETHAIVPGVRATLAVVPGLSEAVVRTLVGSPAYLRDGLTTLMLTGSVGRSGAQWRDYCTFRGIELAPVTERHRQGLHGAGAAADVERLIEAHALLLRRPERGPEAVARAYERLHAWFDAPLTPAERAAAYRPLPPDAIGWQPPAYFSPLSRGEVAEKLAQLDGIAAVHVVVVGDVDTGLARAAIEAAWGDWSPPAGADAARTTADGSPAAASGVVLAARPPADLPVTTVWVTDPADVPVLVVQDTLAPPGPLDATAAGRLDLALHAAARLAAAPAGAAWISPRHAVRWRSEVYAGVALTFVSVPDEDMAGVVRALAARLDAARAAACPKEDVATAVRLARVERWLALDGAEAIAVALEQGRTQPWSLEADVADDAWAAQIAAAYAATGRYVAGVGAVDRGAELKAVESPGATSGSAPETPR